MDPSITNNDNQLKIDSGTEPDMESAMQSLQNVIDLLKKFQTETEKANVTQLLEELRNLVANLSSNNDQKMEGGWKRKKNRKGSKTRGGADVSLGSQGGMIYNTSDLFTKDMQMYSTANDSSINALMQTPPPFSSGNPIVTDGIVNLLSPTNKANALPTVGYSTSGGGNKKKTGGSKRT